ncbi:esterase/lipase family protein [Paludisphaera mucosa]|uniref:Alpha/beta fold hydrolase n=1 Tax=Paludisphaera mucosa TaxID=3030827 RepID=A0ABT6FA65_9BACT|nr:alpha/beta fold hydrolase [Paludisphaera mucosa]MDG3004288.1 alpha/beta fold hydrolase [Paludisphaera mucosa]
MEWRAGCLLLVASSPLLAGGCQDVSIRKVGGAPALSSAGRMERIGRWAARQKTEAGTPPPLRGAALGPGAEDLSDPDLLLARAERSYRAGFQAGRGASEIDARYQVDALRDVTSAIRGMLPGPGGREADPRLARARALHSSAQEEFLRVTSGRSVRLDEDWRAGLEEKGIRLTIARDSHFLSPESFDRFYFDDDFAVKNLEDQHKTEGIGVPLIALRRFDLKKLESREGEEKFLMPRQVYPMTAVLKPEPTAPGGAYNLRLELHDPLVESDVDLGDRAEPLAADLTTPLVYHFVQSPLPILQEIGLLDPQWLEKVAGLYMLHPYEPGKIPVVLVHGLRSSPAAWMHVINDLRGDPVLRERYQVWLFMYPTGTPFPASAAKLRKGLDELREVVDPAHADAAFDRAVLIGHSMGGLISKMMIERSGDELWKLVGRRPFDELKAEEEHKAMLRRVFFFEPHPSIARVVFIATPHRGSDLGDQFIGRLADRLIRLPISMRLLYKSLLAQNGADFFTSEIREGGLPSSIDELRTDNRLLLTLAGLPRKPVPAHSIIGQIDPNLPIEYGSDGVVPYSSSHLDWASSELVVEGDHGCQDEAETLRELRRILYLHLGKALPGGEPAEAATTESPADRRDSNLNLPNAIRSLREPPE